MPAKPVAIWGTGCKGKKLPVMPLLVLTPPVPKRNERPRPVITLPEFVPPADALLAEVARERAERRERIRERYGIELHTWAGLYLARFTPKRSTIKGWRLALTWFAEYLGRLPTIDDLDGIEDAAAWLLARGRHPGSVRVTRAKLRAVRRFVVGVGAIN